MTFYNRKTWSKRAGFPPALSTQPLTGAQLPRTILIFPCRTNGVVLLFNIKGRVFVMRSRAILRRAAVLLSLLIAVGLLGRAVWSQEAQVPKEDPSRWLAPPNQVVAVRAGRLYDPK